MHRIIAFALAATASPLPLAGCGSESDEDKQSESASFTSEQVEFGGQLAQISGHQAVSLQLLEQGGDRRLAIKHADHPEEEVIDSVRGKLVEKDPALLEQLTEATAAGAKQVKAGNADGAKAAFDDTAEIIERSQQAVVGDAADSNSYKASVIASLLTVAAHEYDESVADGEVAEVAEYQDALGFVDVAKQRFDQIAGAIDSGERREIEEGFERLNAAFPSPQPPSHPTAVEDVEKEIEHINAELAEAAGAKVKAAESPKEAREQIEKLLDESLAAYKAGEREKAGEFAAQAYIEHYELIEPEVIEKAPQINSKLEPLLGAQLRKEIEAGAPVSEIQSMVRQAKTLLNQAIRKLEG